MIEFQMNHVYDNVYLVFIDASGHSNIVRNNPNDISSGAFDLLFDKIKMRLVKGATDNRCETAFVWSWLGDGGMIAIYDSRENVSLKTTVDFAQSILSLDLDSIRNEFKNDNIDGELHIRIAIHKGTIKFNEAGKQGFIHSSDINWGAHLEKATPIDSIAISKEVYNVLPQEKKKEFIAVGSFENKDVYIFNPKLSDKLIVQSWIAVQGVSGVSFIQSYMERISQRDKAKLINSAHKTVIDFGTTLNTCSNYLFATERPLLYREAVFNLLKRGGYFKCYMLSPNSKGANQLINLRGEDTNGKLNTSITRFRNFKNQYKDMTEKFEVYQYDLNPNLAAMIIDPEEDDSVCVFSPYLNVINESGIGAGRADMPHYIVSKKSGGLYQYMVNFISGYIQKSRRVV